MKIFSNNYVIPIIFVFILITILAFFQDALLPLGVVLGLIIAFVVFYFFGRNHDGLLFTISLFLVALAWDLVMPPYAVSPDGLISSQPFLGVTSIDYFFGQLFQGMGFNGILLYYMTYGVAFTILFFGATFLTKISKNK